MNPIPAFRISASTTSASTITFIPRAVNASAAPDFELKFLLPCFATVTPAPATAKAAAVEILSVPTPSPPVPTISIEPDGASTGMHLDLIASAAAEYSETDSPLALIAIKKPPTCEGVAFPSNRISNANFAWAVLSGPSEAA